MIPALVERLSSEVVVCDCVQQCAACEQGKGPHCEKGMTLTYNGLDRQTGDLIQVGYAQHKLVLRVPEALGLCSAGPT
ncbi:hypothetical protein D9M68_1000740 [compost metagenome]